MQRWKLTIEYDGTPFNGWQRQEDGVPTVQSAIEDAIFKFCQQNIVIHVAGRTDAGVHAHGQIAHFDLDYGDRPLEGFELAKAINAHLRPAPISIIDAAPVDAEFHARHHAINKLYEYKILCRRSGPALDKNRVWHVKYNLDADTMRKGARHLLGHHDFTTFRASDCQAKSPERTLDRLDVIETPYDNCGGRMITLALEARSFLHHQVRNIAGTLMYVGQGKWTPDDVKTALEEKDRKKGGVTAPPQGLSLVRIDYD